LPYIVGFPADRRRGLPWTS